MKSSVLGKFISRFIRACSVIRLLDEINVEKIGEKTYTGSEDPRGMSQQPQRLTCNRPTALSRVPRCHRRRGFWREGLELGGQAGTSTLAHLWSDTE